MSGFLKHLVGVAMGRTPPGSAHLSLPSRFARPISSGLPEDFEAKAEEEQAPVADEGSAATVAARKPDARPSAQKPAATSGDPFGGERPIVRALQRATAAAAATLDLRDLRGFAPSVRQASFPTAADPVPATPPQNGAGANVVPANPNAAPHLQIGPLPTPVPTEPISEAAMAGRLVAGRQPPVVHVTIDRLDVRASAPAKPASEPRRAGRQPSVSLSDYLRGSEGGRRS